MATIWTNIKKLGAGWAYNDSDIAYNQSVIDTKPVYYNSIGLTSTYTNASKNSSSWLNAVKTGIAAIWATITSTWASETRTWAEMVLITWTNQTKN